MKSADEIQVLCFCCTNCDWSQAWVQTYENERPPKTCLACGAPVGLLSGEPAANVCFREAAEWVKASEVTFRAATNQARYADALVIHGTAENRKGDKP
jgi:NAD-dependent SIR2 family protein deacetylase